MYELVSNYDAIPGIGNGMEMEMKIFVGWYLKDNDICDMNEEGGRRGNVGENVFDYERERLSWCHRDCVSRDQFVQGNWEISIKMEGGSKPVKLLPPRYLSISKCSFTVNDLLWAEIMTMK